MTKNKNLLSIALVLVLVVSLSLPAFAESLTIEQKVAQINNNIDQMIAEAKVEAEQCYLLYTSKVEAEMTKLDMGESQTNLVKQRINQYRSEYFSQIDMIGNSLVKNAYNLVMELYNSTSRSEVKISRTCIPVDLGCKTFAVDPLRFVG